jgi:hypothetical protein
MHRRDRRLVHVWIAPHEVMTLLYDWRRVRTFRLPVLDLPPDCEVVEVFLDPWRKQFGVLLRHESFPEVADGDLIPSVGPLRYEVVEIPRPEPDEPVIVT